MSDASRSGAPRLLFIIAFPTPDKAPIFDGLARLNPNFMVLYVQETSPDHGWGDVTVNHPHVIAGGYRQAAKWVARNVRRSSYDAIVCHGYRTLPYATAFALGRLLGVPMAIRSDTSMDLVALDSKAKRAARRFAMRTIIGRKASAWTVGSKNAQFWLQEIGLHAEYRIQYETPVLPGGFPPRDRVRLAKDPLHIVYVGRLVPEKRVEDLIRATLMLDANIRWTLTIIGKGPLRESLESLAGQDARICFTGALTQADVGLVLIRSDVLVLPSVYEPWGLVVNEALGYGLRVVSSDRVGAAADLIDSDNGAVFPVGDVAALRDRIAESAGHLYQAGRLPRERSELRMAEAARDMANSQGRRGGPRSRRFLVEEGL